MSLASLPALIRCRGLIMILRLCWFAKLSSLSHSLTLSCFACHTKVRWPIFTFLHELSARRFCCGALETCVCKDDDHRSCARTICQIDNRFTHDRLGAWSVNVVAPYVKIKYPKNNPLKEGVYVRRQWKTKKRWFIEHSICCVAPSPSSSAMCELLAKDLNVMLAERVKCEMLGFGQCCEAEQKGLDKKVDRMICWVVDRSRALSLPYSCTRLSSSIDSDRQSH